MRKVLFGLLVVGVAAQAALSMPATAPSTLPSVAQLDPKLADLVRQLGAVDYQSRDQATTALEKLGKDAVPALREAAKSEDPEVRSRAEMIIARIEEAQNPKPAPRLDPRQGLRPGLMLPGGRGVAIRMSVNNGNKTVDVTEGDRKIHIAEGPDGIDMSITETRDGKEVTEQYKAKDAEELKKNHPDAHAIYERFAGGGNRIQLRINGGGVMPLRPRRLPVDPDEQVPGPLEQMLNDKQMPQNMREMIRKHMDHMRKMQNEVLPVPNNLLDGQAADFEAIRKQADEMLKEFQKELEVLQQQQQQMIDQMMKQMQDQPQVD